ncbi:MAG: hypothetical protein IPN10_12285 [Saprospiraceae bacterium]|nr:hypothetical protein [Saprospiraceae bacterium]
MSGNYAIVGARGRDGRNQYNSRQGIHL